MILRLQRIQGYPDFSLGLLYINGALETVTMEDEFRKVKVYGETRIPAGVYDVTLRTVGGMNEKYKAKFDFHKGMLWIRNVPGFEYILIHMGNTDDHSAGCVLVGTTMTVGKNLILNSEIAYKAMYMKILEAFEKKEKVSILVVDELK